MSEFEIDFVSDVNRQHLMAEVIFKGQRLCILDKEGGNDKMGIEFLSDIYILPESVKMKFNLSEFVKILGVAKSELEKCA